MNETLKVQREVAFGKANLTANAPGIVSGFWTGALQKILRRRIVNDGPNDPDVDSFLQIVELPAHVHTAYGAPSQVPSPLHT
jgi:hypothetical protein